MRDSTTHRNNSYAIFRSRLPSPIMALEVRTESDAHFGFCRLWATTPTANTPRTTCTFLVRQFGSVRELKERLGFGVCSYMPLGVVWLEEQRGDNIFFESQRFFLGGSRKLHNDPNFFCTWDFLARDRNLLQFKSVPAARLWYFRELSISSTRSTGVCSAEQPCWAHAAAQKKNFLLPSYFCTDGI